MSELFNALQKLEEQNASDVPKPPPVAVASIKKKRKRVPYLKSILLLLLIVTTAWFCLVTFGSQQAESFLAQIIQRAEKSPVQATDTVVVEPSPAAVHPAGEKENEDTTQSIMPADKDEVAVVRDTVKLPPVPDLVVTEEPVTPLPDKNPPFASIEVQKVPIDEQVSSNELLVQETRKKQEVTARRRLLYRAEKLRLQGETTRTLALYKTAWQMKPDYALANNIAAILLQSQSYQEAEHFLRKALLITPDDPDLHYNLEIALQGQK